MITVRKTESRAAKYIPWYTSSKEIRLPAPHALLAYEHHIASGRFYDLKTIFTDTCKWVAYMNTIGLLNHRVKAFNNHFKARQLIEKSTNFRRAIPSTLVEIVRSDDDALSQL